MENEARTGQPATVHNDDTNSVIIATLLDKNTRMMVKEIERESGIARKSVKCGQSLIRTLT